MNCVPADQLCLVFDALVEELVISELSSSASTLQIQGELLTIHAIC